MFEAWQTNWSRKYGCTENEKDSNYIVGRMSKIRQNIIEWRDSASGNPLIIKRTRMSADSKLHRLRASVTILAVGKSFKTGLTGKRTLAKAHPWRQSLIRQWRVERRSILDIVPPEIGETTTPVIKYRRGSIETV